MWYLTPSRISKMFPETNNLCWRCNEEIRDPQHIWWSCKCVKPFWPRIQKEITRHLRIPLNFSPEACLLHLRLNSKYQTLLSNLLIAAKLLIALYWKTDRTPLIYECQRKCEFVCLMNKLTAIKGSINNQSHMIIKFWNTWSIFTDYCKTTRRLKTENIRHSVMLIGRARRFQIEQNLNYLIWPYQFRIAPLVISFCCLYMYEYVYIQEKGIISISISLKTMMLLIVCSSCSDSGLWVVL